MACRLVGDKPLSEPVLDYCQLEPCQHISVKFQLKYNNFHWRKRIWNVVCETASMLARPQCVNNILALVQIRAWRLLGAKPLSEPTLVSLMTHTCVTRLQWVNSLAPEIFGWNSQMWNFQANISNWWLRYRSLVKLASDEYHSTLLMISP